MIIGMALAAAVATANPQKFDLVCKGTETINGGPEMQWAGRVAVDLNRQLGRWNQAPANADVLVSAAELNFPGSPGDLMSIDRATGKYRYRSRLGGLVLRAASCEQAPFSGLAPTKF